MLAEILTKLYVIINKDNIVIHFILFKFNLDVSKNIFSM